MSRRERRDLTDGSRSTKVMKREVPFSTMVRKEKIKIVRKKNVKGFEVKEEVDSLKSCAVERTFCNRGWLLIALFFFFSDFRFEIVAFFR